MTDNNVRTDMTVPSRDGSKAWRISYPALLEMDWKDKEHTGKNYHASFIVPAADMKSPVVTAIKKAIVDAARAKYPGAFKQGVSGWPLPATLKSPFKPAEPGLKNGEFPTGVSEGDYILKVSSDDKHKPFVFKLDAKGQRVPVTEAADLYGGCYGVVAITVSAHDYQGVSCYVSAFLKTADGERFGGAAANPEGAFDVPTAPCASGAFDAPAGDDDDANF